MIPLFKIAVNKEAALAGLSAVFDSGFINEGIQVAELTRVLSEKLSSDKLVLMNSCTSALTVALRLAGAGPGKNVVSSPMTCIASNTPIINLGAEIRWADVDPDSGMVTVETLDYAIDENTTAVLFVDWAGVPPELDKIDAWAKAREIPTIQDAAHAFLAEYQERPIANFADFTCFSFQAIKHFTCGDGGALICRSDEHFDRARKLKWFGYDREESKDEKGNWKAQQASADISEQDIGYKFNMNNLAAAIGLGNLPQAETMVERHRANAATLDAAFANSAYLRPAMRPSRSNPAFWVYTTILSDDSIDRDALIAALAAEGVSAGQVHVPNDIYSAFGRFKTDLPGVRRFSDRQISLPCGWWVEDEQIAHIASATLAKCAELSA